MGVRSLVFSSDEKHIIRGSMVSLVWVWDASTSETLKELESSGIVTSVAFLGDNRCIVSANSGDELKPVWMWDALTGKKLKMLEGHTSNVNSVALSRNRSALSNLASRLTAFTSHLQMLCFKCT